MASLLAIARTADAQYTLAEQPQNNTN
jgi:hypothetical protein